MLAWISDNSTKAMRHFASLSSPNETGGVLLGWRDGDDRIVADIIGPGPNAVHKPNRFVPDHDWQVAAIAHSFTASGEDLDYLGDWHTHPSGGCYLSSIDRATLRCIGDTQDAPLMLVVAGDVTDFILAGWSVGRSQWWRMRRPYAVELRRFALPAAWNFSGALNHPAVEIENSVVCNHH